MKYTLEENLEIQGFRNGYFIASKSKTLQEKIMKLHHHQSYLKGLIKGIEQYEKDLEIISPSLNKIEQRRAKLKQIADKEKDREQNSFER